MTQVKTETLSWENLVEDANGARRKEVIYEFSNGRKFTEPFDPTGTGIYEEEVGD